MCLGIPGRIVRIDDVDGAPTMRTALVDFDGVLRNVHLTYTPEAVVGDYVVVHSGFAVDRVSEHEAVQTVAAIRALEGGR